MGAKKCGPKGEPVKPPGHGEEPSSTQKPTNASSVPKHSVEKIIGDCWEGGLRRGAADSGLKEDCHK